jgi:putative SOS response-associated peptidase YedK
MVQLYLDVTVPEPGSLLMIGGSRMRRVPTTPTDSMKILKSYTIITTAPNELMKSIHDRMPVILLKEAHA